MDYICPEKRKSKNDWKAKRRFNKYKQGGAKRASNITLGNRDNEGKK